MSMKILIEMLVVVFIFNVGISLDIGVFEGIDVGVHSGVGIEYSMMAIKR